jgi:hypothetical protein
MTPRERVEQAAIDNGWLKAAITDDDVSFFFREDEYAEIFVFWGRRMRSRVRTAYHANGMRFGCIASGNKADRIIAELTR